MKDLIKEYIHYEPETGELFWKKSPALWIKPGDKAGCLNQNGYIHVILKGKCLKAHRVAWLLSYGDWPKQQIDHINNIRTDNRISNLRDVDEQTNQSKKKCHQEGILWGTSFHKKTKTYAARFSFEKKIYCIGYYKTREEAHKVSCEKMKELKNGY